VLQEQLPKFSQVNPELEAKTNLLKSDPALYQLYNDLVVSRLISAEEFWANRFSEGKVSAAIVAGNGGGGKGQSSKPGEEQQEIGLPSAFLVK
jgi:transcription initiation factor TFIIH subunit 1